MLSLLQDLQFALRQFRKSPDSVITAILSLMLGISATTTMFRVVYGVLRGNSGNKHYAPNGYCMRPL